LIIQAGSDILELKKEVVQMAMPESLIQEWDRLSEQNRKHAHAYIRLLLDQQEQEIPRTYPKRRLGILADRFHGIADDFNDPLPEFKEYMT
jgi:hypothetical protein